MKRLVTRRERLEELIAVMIPFLLLALFAVLAPRLASALATEPSAQPAVTR